MSLVTKKAPDFTIDAVVGDGDSRKFPSPISRESTSCCSSTRRTSPSSAPPKSQSFRERHEEFRAANCEVLGSPPTPSTPTRRGSRTASAKLNHPLLADFNKTSRVTTKRSSKQAWPAAATFIIDPKASFARVVQRRPAGAARSRSAAPRAGAPDRRALPGGVEARPEDARQAGLVGPRTAERWRPTGQRSRRHSWSVRQGAESSKNATAWRAAASNSSSRPGNRWVGAIDHP